METPKYAILARDMEERNIYDSACVYGPYDTFKDAVDHCLSIWWEETHDPDPGLNFDQPTVDDWDGEKDGHRVLKQANGDVVSEWDCFYDSLNETFLLHDDDCVSIYQVEAISK